MKPFEILTTGSPSPIKFNANPLVYGLWFRAVNEGTTPTDQKLKVYRFFAADGHTVVAEFPADKVVGIVIRD